MFDTGFRFLFSSERCGAQVMANDVLRSDSFPEKNKPLDSSGHPLLERDSSPNYLRKNHSSRCTVKRS